MNSRVCLWVPLSLPAPPWGSYYASKDATLFGLETLAVRKAYLEQGFIPERYPSEADDHIALELDFMFILADKTLESFNDGQIDEAYGFAKVQNDFLQAHLLNWVPLFAADLQKEEGCMLYPHLAPLLVKVLEHDAAFLERFVPVEN